MAVPQRANTDQLVKKIEVSQIGQKVTLLGPYGRKPGESNQMTYSNKFDMLLFCSDLL